MIELLAFTFYAAAVLVSVYGICASALLMALRVAIAWRWPFGQLLVYCPVCAGFWIALVGSAIAQALGTSDSLLWAERWVYAVSLLILIKIPFPDALTSPGWPGELELVEMTRALRNNPPESES